MMEAAYPPEKTFIPEQSRRMKLSELDAGL
jgi:hypothetical protein